MWQRLTLLRRLQEVQLSPDEAWALLERVKTHTSHAEDREQLALQRHLSTFADDKTKPSCMPL